MKIPLKKGEWATIHFDDHVEDGRELMPCVVSGRIVKKGPKYLTLASWWVNGDEELQKENNKEFCIATALVRGYAPLADWVGEEPHVLH